MDEQQVWTLEERLWLEGEPAYGELVSGECLMAFPAPVGILKGVEITESLRGAPRWSSVRMNQRAVARPDNGVMVLAYLALAEREGAGPYVAYCTSTWRAREDRWRLIQHQQSPEPPE